MILISDPRPTTSGAILYPAQPGGCRHLQHTQVRSNMLPLLWGMSSWERCTSTIWGVSYPVWSKKYTKPFPRDNMIDTEHWMLAFGNSNHTFSGYKSKLATFVRLYPLEFLSFQSYSIDNIDYSASSSWAAFAVLWCNRGACQELINNFGAKAQRKHLWNPFKWHIFLNNSKSECHQLVCKFLPKGNLINNSTEWVCWGHVSSNPELEKEKRRFLPEFTEFRA